MGPVARLNIIDGTVTLDGDIGFSEDGPKRWRDPVRPQSGQRPNSQTGTDSLELLRTTASPAAPDGKIFVVSETRQLSIVKAGKEWEVLSLSNLNEPCYITLALADSRLYLRTQTKLTCFGKL